MADPIPADRRIAVDIDGVQDADGTIERSVYVYSNGAELNAATARQLASALRDAADELDRLTEGTESPPKTV